MRDFYRSGSDASSDQKEIIEEKPTQPALSQPKSPPSEERLQSDAAYKRLWEECMQHKNEAELAKRSRTEFLANMSHELRTPLNAIIGFSQMLQSCDQDYDHDTRREYLDHIQESGYLLLNKIRDLLEIAEIDSGRLKLRDQHINLSDIAEDAVSLHAKRIQEKQLKIHTDLKQRAVVVNIDRAKLTQAMSHLLSNAINFSEEYGNIWLRAEVAPNGSLVLSIEDEGTGIQTDHLEKIREGLAQPNSVFATDPKGIRLGLALAKEFTHLHDGNITLFSTFGHGTLASITLPEERVISVGVRIRHKLEALKQGHHQRDPIRRAQIIKAQFVQNSKLAESA